MAPARRSASRLSRLRAARDAIDRHKLTYTEATQRFGFAEGRSLSHAVQRAFATRLRW